MAGSWGSKRNGVRIGFFYDSINVNAAGTKAQILGGRIRIDRDVRIVDSSNALAWSGSLVSDGSSSNINLDGSGAKTIKSSIAGTWITLSPSTRVQASMKATLSGVNYAGSTLSVSVTVSFPLAGDGGTVSPDIPDSETDAIPDNPWADPAAPDYATEPYLEHLWAVRLPGAADRALPAYEIEVDLDGGRAPYGEARFRLPVDELMEATYAETNPRLLPVVQIDAGWNYGGAANVHTLFSGVIVERRLRVDVGGPYVAITAQTFETVYDYPSNVALDIGNTWTTLAQFVAAAAGLYRRTSWIEPETNAVPLSTQLAEYRAMGIAIDDGVDDFLRSCAGALGQWLHGARDAATPTVVCETDPYPYRRLVELDVAAFAELDRVENLDEWGNIVRLTAQWTDAASGDTRSKRRTYKAASVTSGTGAVRARDVTINVKPPSGAVPPADWAPALKWLRRVNEANRGSYTGRCRALWWLTPRVDGVLLNGTPVDDTAGQVQRVSFQVDAGTMSLTWNVVHP